jgi:glycosyltransferase involved in cell wall biosynthesis
MRDKCVALIEWHWEGHHPTFFALDILALEELGVHILAVSPRPEEAFQTVAQLRQERGLPPSRIGQTTYLSCTSQRMRFGRLSFLPVTRIDWTLRHFRGLERQIKAWQVESGRQVDLLFYACIYDREFKWFGIAQPFLNLPWSGLYLQALSPRRPNDAASAPGQSTDMQKILSSSRCQAVVVLNEAAASSLSAATNKPVVVFPDLTDERLPANTDANSLEVRLRQFANGRPVVGLFGHLRKSKGVLPLARASQHPRLKNVCFAFGGELAPLAFSPEETKILSDVLTQGENTWSHLSRIPDEEQLNALMSACDILYAGYLNFPYSSNILAKAAFLRKPVIVNDGFLIADRVRRFRMGEVVPPNDPDQLVETLAQITRDPKAWMEKNEPRWPDYRREHSFARLKEAFCELLEKI